MKPLTTILTILLGVTVFDVPILFIIGIIIAWFLLKVLLESKAPILAFDYGGVLTKGDYLTETIDIDPEMKNLVSKLGKKHKTVVVTNDNSKVFGHIHDIFGTRKLFDTTFVSSDVGYRKPDPRFYKKVLNSLNAKPRDVIYIDDSYDNVRSAKKLGIKSIHFTSKGKLITDLAKYGVKE